MIKSMTGFGAGESENDNLAFKVEIKAVNQKFLDIDIKLPWRLESLSEKIKNQIRQSLSRGKITVMIFFQEKKDRACQIRIDKTLAKSYYDALNEVSELMNLPQVKDVRTIANFQNVLKIENDPEDENIFVQDSQTLISKALGIALNSLIEMRTIEGKNICEDFLQRLEKLDAMTDELLTFEPKILQRYRERLQKTLQDVLKREAIELDEVRICQEVALYADKINYTEENIRLKSHFQQFRNMILNAKEPIGRKLDFLLQEMNREVNTTASKANSAEVTPLILEMKSEIEKLREQVQNIE